ncbi:type II toxin-antitoxin system YafQ family toxin [Candidatus Kaiserbacteria bacterium]|nr:type II toxin-antitoxin system YafQ family toxin [Candidatus Kaiserbacteria bacterium]
MWTVIHTKRFAKGLATMQKRGNDIASAERAIAYMQKHGQAESRAHPHKLTGVWEGYWESHIGFDWLLIYTITSKTITLWRTGTHEDLFG